jgi:hypothetical protein
MLRHRLLLATLATLSLVTVQPLLAATVQVGGCKPNLANYPTISAAVAGAPSGSTIDVCPGTYAEQVTITERLNLTGVANGTANQASITVPSTGLVQNTISFFGEPVAAQVLVLGPGPVNITNITVDGTGGDMGCSSWLAGIFYASGSSGTVNRVRASNQIDATCGVGIWAENGGSSSYTVTVQNSTVYSADSVGIFAGSGATPTLTANLNNNVVNASGAVAAIDSDSVNGNSQIHGNDVSNSIFGVYDISTINVQANSVLGATYGIFLGNGGAASGNKVSGSSNGVLLGAGGATVSNNTIMSSTAAGVELGCFSATVNGNLINDAPVGVDAAPAAIGSNTFANTATTITNGCAAAALAARTVRTSGAARVTAIRSNLSGQWHTPATPFGTRRK